MSIAYVPYDKIDLKKWDACISLSANSLLYARSFYLDNMAAHWDGLVLNDYEAVMPLTWKKKLSIKYLYQPAFIQQGGIFSQTAITEEITNLFLKAAFNEFKFAEITLNYANQPVFTDEVEISTRTNYILYLNKPYEALYNNYDPAFTKSLRRIKKFGFEYVRSNDYTQVIQLYGALYGKRIHFSKSDFTNFEKVCSELEKDNNVITRIVYNAEKELLAAVVLLKDGARLYNIISCITAAGKKLEANYYLYDRILNEFAGTGLELDLEGSDVKGIARFYNKFNPLSQPYPFIRYNQLHPLIKIFKP